VRKTGGGGGGGGSGGGVDSSRKLAAELGVQLSALQKWPANPTWSFGTLPTRARPWPAERVEAVRAWRGSLRADRSAAGDYAGERSGEVELEKKKAELARRAKVHIDVERARQLKLANDKAEGKLLDRDEVERQSVAKVIQLRVGLLTVLEEFELRLPDDVREDLEERVHELLTAFAEGRPFPPGIDVEDLIARAR
jgi:hypothetical protein